MRPITHIVLAWTLVFITPLSLIAQTPSPQQSDDKIVSETTEVIFDALVKDKKGRPVKDLQLADFQIFEDGVPQDIKSFRLVAGDSPEATPATATPTNRPGPKAAARVLEAFNSGRLGTVALVFDRLSPDSRARAHDAAIAYLGNGVGQTDYIGVFGIDQTLTVFQTFSNDDKLIREAIDQAGNSTSTVPSVNKQQINDMIQRDLALQQQAAQAEATASTSQNANAIGAVELAKVFNQMALRAAQGFERMEQTEQGRSTTEGLLSIISAIGRLPGRKALVFFSEGVSIPTSVAANFQTVISNANRANVSIYAVDSAGLRAQSTDLQTGQSLTALGQQSVARAGSSQDSLGSMMRDNERAEELVRSNPEGVLGQLANQTGGFLVSSTNNLGPRLRQVNDDLHSYYVLTYTPKNLDYDGKFRQINLKIKRSGVDVQARKGYYAVGAKYDTPVLSFEAPALAMMSKSPASTFQTHSRAFSFPEARQPGFVSIFVEVPGNGISFVGDPEKKTYRADFAIVGVVKDEFGRPIRKVSGHYVLNGALDQLDVAKRTPIFFYRETNLEPGNYNLETIVYDSTNSQCSLNRSTVMVSDFDETKLRISNLIVVRKTQKSSPSDLQSNPLKVGDLVLYPNLGEALHKAGSKGLSLFLTIYLPKGSTTAPKMSIELDQGGQVLGQLPVQLPAVDPSGRIQYTGIIPIDAFPPGEYELKATVTDGVTKAMRSERFSVQP